MRIALVVSIPAHPLLHKTTSLISCRSFLQMIYQKPVDAQSAAAKLQNMNFNLLPGLRGRPTDFSVSSILGNNNSQESSPTNNTATSPAAMWPATGRLATGLSPLHSKLPDMLAAEMMLQQQHQLNTAARAAGIDNNATPSTPDSANDISDDAQVELEMMDLWEQFHDIGTEMVITKCGR